MAPSVVAAYHQHLFCARLDMAVDDPEGGKGLVVSEVSSSTLAPDVVACRPGVIPAQISSP